MLSANEIKKANAESRKALKDRFFSEGDQPSESIEKSEDSEKDFFITQDGLDKYKEDLFKSIDNGEMNDESLEKSLDQISSLKKETRNIDGKEVLVYTKS